MRLYRTWRSAAPGVQSTVGLLWLAGGSAAASAAQHLMATAGDATAQPVSAGFFLSLERMARLVDISYCVGYTGISPPFSCASRCKEFPTLHLVTTWHTGLLMSDSCGYIAVDHGSGDAKVGIHEPAVVVGFRGTYSIANTVVDLSTIPQEYVPYPAPDDDGGGEREPDHTCANCTVHMGFLASWRSAREKVVPALRALREKHPGYPVHLVGHSLGGAVAALAALELKLSLRWDDVQVTTFGEPRVGNTGFVRYLDAAFGLDHDDNDDDDDDDEGSDSDGHNAPDLERRVYRRVTHVDDPVPLLPLSEWGFRPHGGEVYIAKADLAPEPADVRLCRGDQDPACIAGADSSDYAEEMSKLLVRRSRRQPDGDQEEEEEEEEEEELDMAAWARPLGGIPSRLKLWQLFFAHRDYFWRLGLCVPGGDPADWGRDGYNLTSEPKNDGL